MGWICSQNVPSDTFGCCSYSRNNHSTYIFTVITIQNLISTKCVPRRQNCMFRNFYFAPTFSTDTTKSSWRIYTYHIQKPVLYIFASVSCMLIAFMQVWCSGSRTELAVSANECSGRRIVSFIIIFMAYSPEISIIRDINIGLRCKAACSMLSAF